MMWRVASVALAYGEKRAAVGDGEEEVERGRPLDHVFKHGSAHALTLKTTAADATAAIATLRTAPLRPDVNPFDVLADPETPNDGKGKCDNLLVSNVLILPTSKHGQKRARGTLSASAATAAAKNKPVFRHNVPRCGGNDQADFNKYDSDSDAAHDDDSDQGGWQKVSHKRRGSKGNRRTRVSNAALTTHTLILKPQEPREENPNIVIRYLDKSNQIAVDTDDRETRDALLTLMQLPINGKSTRFQAYEALQRDQIRGVIHNAGGMTSEQLMMNLHCRACDIISARPIVAAVVNPTLNVDATKQMHNNQQAPQSTLEPQPDYEALFSARLMQLEHIMAKYRRSLLMCSMAQLLNCGNDRSRGRDDGGDIPTVIQWNCRSIKKKKADMILRWGLSHNIKKPAVLALQEVNCPTTRLPGYDGYGFSEDTDTSACAVVYVDRKLNHTQLDTKPWCSGNASVTGCRIQLTPERTILVFSVYMNPESTRKQAKRSVADFSYIQHFQRIYPKDTILVCGDFNAQHVAWNYKKCSPRGRRLMEDFDRYGLTLLNLPEAHTRLGQDARQADTTPDLTWSSKPRTCHRKLLEDPLGSDHLPIAITVKNNGVSCRNSSHKRECLITHWDEYRTQLQETASITDLDSLTKAMRHAKHVATKTLRIAEDHPDPDRHLLHLWNRRLRLLSKYRAKGRPQTLRSQLLSVQKEIEKYTSQLASEQWMEMCEQINGSTNSSKAWGILRSLLGRRKTSDGAPRVALKEGITNAELAEKAADVFFPQTNCATDRTYARDDAPREDDDLNQPFTVTEFEDALSRMNTREKTEFVVIHGGRRSKAKDGEKASVNLSFGRAPVLRKRVIRILGMFLDEQCISTTWFNKTVKTTKQVTQVLQRIAKCTRGVREEEMKHFVQAFIHSRIMYGAFYHPITRTQLQSLERLSNEARRVITGLPKYTPLPALKSCSALGDIADLMSMHEVTQVTRLQPTHAGRATLSKIGHDVSHLPVLPHISPPWEHIQIADPRPLPKNMGNEHSARRQAHARSHEKYTQESKPPEHILRNAPEEIEQHSDWYDPMEAIAQAKCYRRSYLLDVSNPLDIPPLPSSADTRRQQVLLRQVQTGTLLTPFLVQRFRRDRDLGTPNIGICGHCNTRADLAHLIWDCPLYSGTRQRVIAAIPPEWRPTSFQAWAQPGRITGAAANELWRSLLEYLDDPKAPAVGTRLRLGRDSQNVNSRDAH
ncbi:hypothetical protein HPB50_010750 [Hyalomma asiaticum]|uniref:Uncharacterized protein n=1 Tax=Hyalomma asiaticum TaxID=266040 RepID=A0ACB7TGJ6_HYAAI|nr:hypothetical protein HPB50_010750 [Hyalomma asiaticum]